MVYNYRPNKSGKNARHRDVFQICNAYIFQICHLGPLYSLDTLTVLNYWQWILSDAMHFVFAINKLNRNVQEIAKENCFWHTWDLKANDRECQLSKTDTTHRKLIRVKRDIESKLKANIRSWAAVSTWLGLISVVEILCREAFWILACRCLLRFLIFLTQTRVHI